MNWLTGSRHGEAKKLISLLEDPSKRERAAQELIKLGADAVPALMDALQTQDVSLLPLYQQILARIPSASPALTKALGSAHPLLRGRAAEVLALGRDRAAVPALLEAIKGEYYTVRSRAALALGNIGDVGVIPALLPLLKDRESEVRVAACIAVGKFRDPATFDEIANILLDDPAIEARRAAAIALGETRHPAAIPFLMEALRDPFWWYEREEAVADLLAAFERMGEAAVEPLIEALKDREGTVRKFAATLLGSIGDPRAIEPLGMALYDLHHDVGKASAEALAQFGAASFEVLVDALRHPEAAVREHAVIGLGKIRDARVAPLLIEMLNDPERIVQKQAIRALGQLRDERSISALKKIAADRSDREMSALAKEAIEKLRT